MARNTENPKQIALPAELVRALSRVHASVASQGYLGTPGDLAREILGRELTGRRPEEVAFAQARIAGSNRGYFFMIGQLKRAAKSLFDFFEHDEQVFGLQHCPTCGGPILPELERVLAELRDPQATAAVERLDGGSAADGRERSG